MFICDRRTGAQQSRGLVMSEIHRRRPRRYKFGFSFGGNDRRLSSKGTRPENRDAPVSPDLSPSIRDDRGYLHDFEFSLVGKTWDSRETVKSPIVWDFPDI